MKNEIGMTCNTHRWNDKCIQNFHHELWRNKTT